MPAGGGASRRFGPWRRELRAYAELLGASALAIAQPAFGTLSRNVGTFIARGTTSASLVALALLIAFVPPAVAWCVEVVVGLIGATARRVVHALLLGAATGLFALQLAKTASDLGPGALLAIGAVAAVAGVLLVLRTQAFPTLLRFAVIALPIFLIQFLLFSPAHRAVTGSEVSASGARIGDPKRVVMVVFDEFPLESILDGSGRIDADLYPNLAALADTSTWYRDDTTVAPDTEKAVPAILTGQYPKVGQVPVAADHPDSIFRLLAGTYRMNVHEPVERICPTSVCAVRTTSSSGLRGFASLGREAARLFTTAASPHRAVATYAELVAIPPARPATREFLTSIKPSGSKPVFDYAHLLLPHQPWHYLPTFQDVSPEGTPFFSKANLETWKSEGTATVARQIHLAQARAADTFLGELRARLEAIGEWDDSLVVVTADHGIAFTGGEAARTASRRTAPQILWTPLIMKAPGQRTGVVDDRRMQSIDVFPTMAAALGADIPWSIDGVSAATKPRAHVPPRLYQWPGLLQPDDAEVAKQGEYLTYSQARFAEVLAARAAAPGGPTELRTYRVGPYADLVGTTVPANLPDLPGGPTETYLRTGTIAFSGVDPNAPTLPQVWQRGYVQQLGDVRTIAFTLNGVVAGFGFADPVDGGNGLGYYFAALAPTLLRPGVNTIAAYAVTGDPAAPVLDPVRIAN